MKLKKTKKSKAQRGNTTYGWGARKKHMGSGHRGGFGMAGTGKRADHKKSLIIVKYDKYFGKQGFTSRKTERRNNKVMNLEYINKNIETLKRKYANKEGVLDLKDYKILAKGELTQKIVIKTKSASENAIKKIEQSGGKIILTQEKKVETKKTEKILGKDNKKEMSKKEDNKEKISEKKIKPEELSKKQVKEK